MSDLNEILEIKKETIYKDVIVNNKKNPIGSTIKLMGWIIMSVGIILGLIIGASLTVKPPSSWVYGIVIIISSFISGILFIGFGEIIILLNYIKYNINSK